MRFAQELAYAGLSDGQYWRSVILALLVIGLVIAGIASAICTYGFVDELLYWSGTRLRLEQILGTTSVFPSRLPATWVSDRAFVFQNDDGDLSSYDPASDSVATLIANCTLVSFNYLATYKRIRRVINKYLNSSGGGEGGTKKMLAPSR